MNKLYQIWWITGEWTQGTMCDKCFNEMMETESEDVRLIRSEDTDRNCVFCDTKTKSDTWKLFRDENL